jgi:1,4-alpha-glucan branching enzyme
LVGDFNAWEVGKTPMSIISDGIWEVFVAGLKQYDTYKYAITRLGKTVFKTDPYGLHFETAPSNGAKLYDLDGYKWSDSEWLEKRANHNPYESPMNTYEVHATSWKRYGDGNVFDYRKLADELIPYVKKMNYSHIELMPITEYPFEGSWGYQVTGLFAPTSRMGTPHDFMYFVNKCHKAGIGVILDFVLAHFPKDEHGLSLFDGTPTYEYTDETKGEHKEWGTKVFDYAKPEVNSFLISAVSIWFEKYHIDGIRCDAVAAMLYLDYCRKPGEWHPNAFGGNYNLEAKDFLQKLNTAILSKYKGAVTIAEESTAYPLITQPPKLGGLGFNFKWNMGWMNDSLEYISANPFFRKDMHKNLTFSITYAYSENYILPLSHDEVVHGKKSLIGRIPTSYDEQFEGLKAYYGYLMSHPGKKLMFMGCEFGQFIEWKYDDSLEWFLLDYPRHSKLQQYVKDLNGYYLNNPCLWRQDCKMDGFSWVSVDDKAQNIISYLRYDNNGDFVLAVINFSPVERKGYKMGVPKAGSYKVDFVSTLEKYGGITGKKPQYKTKEQSMHNQPYSISIDIPANSVMFIKLTLH